MEENRTATDHPFIQFAKRLQSQTLIQQALFQLEKQSHIKANLLLYLFWIALSARGRLRKTHCQQLDAAIQPWHERILGALQNLQAAAQGSQKNNIQIQQLVQAEIAAANEIEQQLLAEAVILPIQIRNQTQKLNDACYNLVYYCKLSQHVLNADDHQALLLLLQAIFPELLQTDIYAALQQTIHNLKIPQKAFSQLQLM